MLLFLAPCQGGFCNLLLEEDRSESAVEGTNTLVLEDLSETTDQTVGKGRLGDKTDTGSLERAEGNGGKELGTGSRSRVDKSTVLASGLETEHFDRLLLEELISTELECTLEEITGEGWADTSQKSTSTFILDDLAETADHTTVVGGRIKLDSGLDAVQR